VSTTRDTIEGLLAEVDALQAENNRLRRLLASIYDQAKANNGYITSLQMDLALAATDQEVHDD
jgi:regulator of replication initiation timing